MLIRILENYTSRLDFNFLLGHRSFEKRLTVVSIKCVSRGRISSFYYFLLKSIPKSTLIICYVKLNYKQFKTHEQCYATASDTQKYWVLFGECFNIWNEHVHIQADPTNIYLLKASNINSRKECVICSNLTIKVPKWYQ